MDITKQDKIKLRTLASPQFVPALTELLSKEYSPRTSYWLNKVTNKVNSELTEYHKVLEQTQKKYAELDTDGKIVVGEGNVIKFKDGTQETFEKEFQELLDTEVEVLKISSEAILTGDSKIKPWVFAALDELMY